MIEFAEKLFHLNKVKEWNYILATCGEAADLDGVQHNHCVDDRLMVRFGYESKKLMTFLGAEIIDAKQQPDLFADIEPLEIPANAILLDNSRYAVINRNNKDKGQRMACGCMKSKDIGEYNTCPHLCEYCYANASKDSAIENWKCHKANPWSETITGR